MTLIISVRLSFEWAVAGGLLRGLRWGGAMGGRSCLGVAQGLAWSGLGVGGGEPGALLWGDQTGQGSKEVFEVFEGVEAVVFGGGDEAVILKRKMGALLHPF